MQKQRNVLANQLIRLVVIVICALITNLFGGPNMQEKSTKIKVFLLAIEMGKK